MGKWLQSKRKKCSEWEKCGEQEGGFYSFKDSKCALDVLASDLEIGIRTGR